MQFASHALLSMAHHTVWLMPSAREPSWPEIPLPTILLQGKYLYNCIVWDLRSEVSGDLPVDNIIVPVGPARQAM